MLTSAESLKYSRCRFGGQIKMPAMPPSRAEPCSHPGWTWAEVQTELKMIPESARRSKSMNGATRLNPPSTYSVCIFSWCERSMNTVWVLGSPWIKTSRSLTGGGSGSKRIRRMPFWTSCTDHRSDFAASFSALRKTDLRIRETDGCWSYGVYF